MSALAGVLWFDNWPEHSITQKVQDAMLCHFLRFGHKPAVCHVSTKDSADDFEIEGVPVKAVDNILQNHVWCQEAMA